MDAAPATTVSDLDKLRFYRDEIKHEFSLLATRANLLVTCQSFLIVPYAILNTVANFRAALASEYLIAALGLIVIVMLVQPMRVGERTIEMWLSKQRALIKRTRGLHDLAIERDLRPGVEVDPAQDWEHARSMAFSRYSPWAFGVFWVLAIVVATARAYVGV